MCLYQPLLVSVSIHFVNQKWPQIQDNWAFCEYSMCCPNQVRVENLNSPFCKPCGTLIIESYSSIEPPLITEIHKNSSLT